MSALKYLVSVDITSNFDTPVLGDFSYFTFSLPLIMKNVLEKLPFYR